jgi:hypothetical protein
MLSMRCVQALKLTKCEFSKEGPHLLPYGVEAQLVINFNFRFEFEFRKHCTIKRDAVD